MEWYRTTADLLYGGLCWTFIVCCVVSAVFRWFHLCRPYDQDPDYYYPARRYVCAFYVSQLLYLPFVLRPSEPHTILYARALCLPLFTTFLPLTLNRYFRLRAKTGRNFGKLFCVGVLAALGLVGLVTLVQPDNVFLSSPTVTLSVAGAVTVAMCVAYWRITVWLRRQIDRYQKAEYSNEADFPCRLAQKLIFLPWVVILFAWSIILVGDRLLLAIAWGAVSVLAVYFAVIILHPQREKCSDGAQEAENLETVIERAEELDALSVSDCAAHGEERVEAVRRRVIAIARRRYLEPHLTRRDVIAEFDYGERTVAGAVISAVGFYNMINALRLEHARRYAEAHPSETKESVALSSGFKDRFAMRHAALKVGDCDHDILDGFTPLLM